MCILIDIDLANISGYGTTLVAPPGGWCCPLVSEIHKIQSSPGGGTGHQGGSISRNVRKVNVYMYADYDICFQKCMIFD